MKKKFLLFLTLCSLVLLFVACSSAEEDETLEYHNAFVDNVNDKGTELEQLYDKMTNAPTDGEALEISNNEITPIIDEMKAFMDEQDPETDVVKEYHQMRMDWFDQWSEGYYLENEALDNYINNAASEEETNDLMEQSVEKFNEAHGLSEKAEAKAEELIEEYGFEEEEN